MTRTATLAAIAALTGAAHADVVINEVQASTSGSDWEFVELYNTSGADVDLSGWQVELWDSDTGNVGGADGAAPYVIPGGATIPAGGYYTIANDLAQAGYGFAADLVFGANSIENSSFTIILADGPLLGSNVLDSILMIDSVDDAGNANRAGDLITPGAIVGPDGDFLPSGFYRIGDAGANFGFLEFDVPSPSATPGAKNIPAPATLALLGFGSLANRRRR